LVVECVSAGGTDEYVAVLGATAPSRFRESLSSDEGTPMSFPIGFSNLSKGTVELSKTSLAYGALADFNQEEQDKQENQRKESATKAADEERKQKEQERKDREELGRTIEAQSQNPRAQM
jgi:peptide subunit release factor RF-3